MTISDDELDGLFRAWAKEELERVPEFTRSQLLPRLADDSETRRVNRPRRLLPVISAALVVCAIAAGIALFTLGQQGARSERVGGGDSTPPTTTPSSPPQDIAGLVVSDGASVRVAGRVVVAANPPMKLCEVTASDLLPKPADSCDTELLLSGSVDVGSLQQRKTVDGVTTGLTTLIGRYESGRLTVTDQAPYVEPRSSAFAEHVPCPAPAGGWPDIGRHVNIDIRSAREYARQHASEVADVAVLRPSDNQAVLYVLTTGDLDDARRTLSDDYSAGLCVNRSEFRPEQIQDTLSRLSRLPHATTELTTVKAVGKELTDTGQEIVSVDVPVLTHQVAQALLAEPEGLVQANVWVKPSR